MQAYYSKKELKKIIVTFMGETGNATYDYYFLNEDLYFALYTLQQFDRPFYEEGRVIKKVEEQRFYFNNNKLIRWIDGRGQYQDSNSSDYKKTEAKILVDINEFKEELLKND